MTIFEGNEFSTIHDEMPSRRWNEEKFFSDWESQIRATNELYGDHEIQVAKETIIKEFYSTYSELLEMVDDEKIPDDEKNTIKRKINLAMVNVLEYGQRRSEDIVLSLQNKKLSPSENSHRILNGAIDNLILEIEKADKKFHEELSKRKKL